MESVSVMVLLNLMPECPGLIFLKRVFLSEQPSRSSIITDAIFRIYKKRIVRGLVEVNNCVN
jgi:hypothetical protein